MVSNGIASYGIVSSRIESYRIVSHRIILNHIVSYQIISYLVGSQDINSPMHRGSGDVEDKMNYVGGHYVQVLFGDGSPGAFFDLQPFKRDVHGCVPRDIMQLKSLLRRLQTKLNYIGN